MATYKELKGFKVKSLSSDPTVDAGQIWYNTTSNTLKYDGAGAGSWSSGGNLIAGREQGGSAGISQTSALYAGGANTHPPSSLAITEIYNGTAWSEVGDLNTGRKGLEGNGTETAAFVAGGQIGYPGVKQVIAETYNGVAWSETGVLNTARTYGTGTGTTTAGLFCAGDSPVDQCDLVELYNGTGWTETTELNTATTGAGGNGPQSACFVVGKWGSGLTQQYNGTGWTTVGSMNLGRNSLAASGTTSLSLAMGGYPPLGQTNAVEQYDGSSWTSVATLATPRTQLGGCGSNANNSVAYGGYQADYIYGDWTEEWDGAPASVRTVTTS